MYMKVFRQFNNTTNILEIIESSKTKTGYTFKTCRYKLNQKGCYVKINCNTCNISFADRKKCLEKEKDDQDWYTSVVTGI